MLSGHLGVSGQLALWLSSVAHICGSHVRLTFRVRSCGSHFWLASWAHICVSHLCLASVAHICGSHLWLASLARICDSHLWLASALCLLVNHILPSLVEDLMCVIMSVVHLSVSYGFGDLFKGNGFLINQLK